MLRKNIIIASCILILSTVTACVPEQWFAYVGSSNLIPKKETSGWSTYQVPDRPVVHTSKHIYDPFYEVTNSGNAMVFRYGFQENTQVKDCYQYSENGDARILGGVTRVVFDLGITLGWDLKTQIDAGNMCQSVLQGDPWTPIFKNRDLVVTINDQQIVQSYNIACTKENKDLVCWSTKSKVGFRYDGVTIHPLYIS